MSEIKVNSIKGVGASAAAITVNNTDGTCTANITNNLSNRNLIINGAMQVAQRGTSSTANGFGTVDRFLIFYDNTNEAPTQAQADVASGTTPYTLGFRKSYKITNGDQTGGAGADDALIILYRVEAQDLANSGWNYTSSSSYVTFSFWVKSSVPQNFYVTFKSGDGTPQKYAMETGSLSQDTWTKVTKTIPGASNVQFDNDNGEGLEIEWSLFRGTDATGSMSLNAWAANNNSVRTPDQTNTWYTTNDATFEITGVQLEVSDYATSFEFRSYADEFQKCLRYYEQMSSYGKASGYFAVGFNESTTEARHALLYKTYKRTTPTITTNGDANFKNHNTGSSVALSSLSIVDITPQSARCVATSSSAVLNDGGCSILSSYDTDDAIIKIDAEL